MTLKHKIKLIFCRINWWFRITNEARAYNTTLRNYRFINKLYNKIYLNFLEEEKKKPDSPQTHKLRAQVQILAEILDIKQ